MVNGIILPTFELVTDCLPYDKVFQFLRGGVKDVVRDSIVASSFYRNHASPLDDRSALMSSVLHLFEDHCMEMWGDAHVEPNTSFMDEYLAKIAIIEYVVQEIEDVTLTLIEHLIGTPRFEVDEYATRWQGRDLLVYLKRLERIRG